MGLLYGEKEDTTLWFVFQNIRGFLTDDEMDLKFEALQRFIMDHAVDIYGFTEMNTSWDLLPEKTRPAQRSCGWWEMCQWSLSYNCTEVKETRESPYQPGGTGILCVNQVAHRSLKPGDDPTGLGRWMWMRIRGPRGFFLWVVSIYCPCFSNGPTNNMSGISRR